MYCIGHAAGYCFIKLDTLLEITMILVHKQLPTCLKRYKMELQFH